MGPRFVTPTEEPELHFLVHHFAEQAATPAPRVALLRDEDPILYFTGSPAYLVISEGSLNVLSSDEFERRLRQELLALGHQRSSRGLN